MTNKNHYCSFDVIEYKKLHTYLLDFDNAFSHSRMFSWRGITLIRPTTFFKRYEHYKNKCPQKIVRDSVKTLPKKVYEKLKLRLLACEV